ncbi:MAG: ABC transporter substrate-binding protein, partial [Rhodoferax sp.]|nr:ABC transporter substrate-binding protein [Rhodoferax sp.]
MFIPKSISRSTCLYLASALLGLAPLAPAFAKTVKIGVLAPLTGPSAADGQEFVNGVKWAVDEANAAGGVAGHTFAVVTADVKDGSAANVTSAVEHLTGTSGLEVVITGYANLSMF